MITEERIKELKAKIDAFAKLKKCGVVFGETPDVDEVRLRLSNDTVVVIASYKQTASDFVVSCSGDGRFCAVRHNNRIKQLLNSVFKEIKVIYKDELAAAEKEICDFRVAEATDG